jgi:hypothetical protein
MTYDCVLVRQGLAGICVRGASKTLGWKARRAISMRGQALSEKALSFAVQVTASSARIALGTSLVEEMRGAGISGMTRSAA